jgi:MFS family permease
MSLFDFTQDTHFSRTRIFFYAAVATFISELIAPPLGSFLMENLGSKSTYFTTLPWDLLSFVLIFLLPETLKIKEEEAPEPLNSHIPQRPSNRLSRYSSWMQEKYSTTKDHVRKQVLPLLARREILLGVAALVVAVFSRPVSEMMIQYTSARFQWKLSKAAFLISYQALLRLLSFSALFPAAHYYLNRRLRATETTDLTFGIWSSVVTVIGLIGMGISTTWVGVILGRSSLRRWSSADVDSNRTVYIRGRCSGCVQIFCDITGV